MSGDNKRNYPWIFWPFVALWDLLAFILRTTGRIIGAVIGLVLMIAGGALTVTFIGAPIGIPLAVFGFLLVLRSLF
jgi:hypothetical protein